MSFRLLTKFSSRLTASSLAGLMLSAPFQGAMASELQNDVEFVTEVTIASLPIEDFKKDHAVALKRIVEEDIEADVARPIRVTSSKKMHKNITFPIPDEFDYDLEAALEKEALAEQRMHSPRHKNAKNVAVNNVTEDHVATDVLLKARERFRAMLSDSAKSSLVDSKFVGSLRESDTQKAVAFQETYEDSDLGFEDNGTVKFREDKVYSYEDGKILGMSQSTADARVQSAFTAPVAGGPTFSVQAFPEAFPEKKNGIVDYPALASNHSAPPKRVSKFGLDDDGINSASLKNGMALTGNDVLPSTAALGAEQNPPSSSVSPEREVVKRATLKGRVVVPSDLKATDVVIQVAGTSTHQSPDEQGFFEFPEMPVGSRSELIIWDGAGQLARRVIPVVISEFQRDYEIQLEKSSLVTDRAQAFGVRQDMMQSGFCATLGGAAGVELAGAKIVLSGAASVQGPYFFSSSNLPDLTQQELSDSGRFCVFNVNSTVVDVQVQLTNGKRRTFTMHLMPSTFENLELDMELAVYRKVTTVALKGSKEAFETASKGESFDFGTTSDLSWVNGGQTSVWSPVKSVLVTGEKGYAMSEAVADAPLYFPAGQELSEVSFASAPGTNFKAFALVGKDEVITADVAGQIQKRGNSQKIFRDDKNIFNLKVMGEDVVDELQKLATTTSSDAGSGSAFVSLNLAALEVDYKDVSVSLRDIWTGQRVSSFNFLKSNAASPQFLRGFFGNIPEGQYSLVITARSGALLWTDVVRAREGSMQVISIRE